MYHKRLSQFFGHMHMGHEQFRLLGKRHRAALVESALSHGYSCLRGTHFEQFGVKILGPFIKQRMGSDTVIPFGHRVVPTEYDVPYFIRRIFGHVGMHVVKFHNVQFIDLKVIQL